MGSGLEYSFKSRSKATKLGEITVGVGINIERRLGDEIRCSVGQGGKPRKQHGILEISEEILLRKQGVTLLIGQVRLRLGLDHGI